MKVESSQYVVGIDEVGRGPIAGPVVVCACAIQKGVSILSYFPKQQLKDSKKLSEKKRKEIIAGIKPLVDSSSIIFGIGEVSALLIDEIGISQAINNAISQALQELHAEGLTKDVFVFLDGSLHAPKEYAQETIIQGDEKIPEIALASIYAKEYRDTTMKKLALEFPGYSFEKHVGYGTKAHYLAISQHGLTSLHRKSFLKRIIG